MKINELCKALGADVQTPGDGEREVTQVTAGDLLSFVMGTAPEGAAWVTIQTHLNVAAVAVLKDLPLILIAAGRKATPELKLRCEEEKICIATVGETIYGICGKLAELGLGE
ncbi:serine kinase [Synergistaceae bacterium OttesenSCG-928-D05]|nr:serine kinase [Synergistaceae bacterium OttesenSCG-928-D05]